ncbi:MAG: hypothetical protein ACFCAD_09360 [Pleurocapsa sp.]
MIGKTLGEHLTEDKETGELNWRNNANVDPKLADIYRSHGALRLSRSLFLSSRSQSSFTKIPQSSSSSQTKIIFS